jgi:FdhD protein
MMPARETMADKGTRNVEGIAPEIDCYQFSDGKWRKSSVAVPQEIAFTIFVNGQELVSILCTPTKLNCLVFGYLYSEGVITGMGDVLSMRVCQDESSADVLLSKPDFILPQRRILTSGCGGGVSFSGTEVKKVSSDLRLSPEQILSLMKKMLRGDALYRISGGIHTSALCDSENILVVAEDIGRHNTLDKIQGECLLRKMPTKDGILLTTGRLSSEMLRKTAVMEIPVVASLTSPTEKAIALARDLGITLIGYAGGRRLSVYSHEERLLS